MKFAKGAGKSSNLRHFGMIERFEAASGADRDAVIQQAAAPALANRYIGAKDVFFIGRGVDYAISMEGSLKLKEISYIHSEAYAAGS